MKNIISFITKNKFVVISSCIIMIIVLLLIPALTVQNKYLVVGEYKDGYMQNVDEHNFDDVYNGDYPNVRVFEKKSLNNKELKSLSGSLIPSVWGNFNTSGDKYIIVKSDDINASKITYEPIKINNYTDQVVYDSLYQLEFHASLEYYETSSGTGIRRSIGFRNKSNNLQLVNGESDRDQSFMNKIVINKSIIRITINPLMMVDEELLNDQSITFVNFD